MRLRCSLSCPLDALALDLEVFGRLECLLHALGLRDRLGHRLALDLRGRPLILMRLIWRVCS